MKLTGGKRTRANYFVQQEIPFVSVVTVCYNAHKTLPETISSIIRQKDERYEFIVVDGDSGQETITLLQENDEHIDHWISEEDSGIYNAMNKGAAIARGTYLAFLNADDQYLPQTIESIIDVLNTELPDVIYGNMVKKRVIDGEVFFREEIPFPEKMPMEMGFFHPATFIRRSLFRKLGGYNEKYKQAADFDLLLKAWNLKATFKYLPVPLAVFSLEGVSNTSCQTYRECVEIHGAHKTGFKLRAQQQYLKCRIKNKTRRIIYTLADLTGMERELNKIIRKNWK